MRSAARRARSSRGRRAATYAAALAAALASTDARAGEPSLATPVAAPDPVAATDPTALFRYRSPAKRYVLRAALEEVGLLGLGFAQYWANVGANTRDWDLDYDWESFRSKLTGSSVVFDTNHFDTNHLTHPAAGLFYYIAARGNRLSQLESFLFTTAASTLWEYVGEMREQASVNDLLFTPVAGMALGEATTQVGAFFHRGRRNVANGVLGFLFAPSKTVHDWIDGATPETAQELDRFGLPKDIAHDVRVGLGGSVTSQSLQGGGSRAYSDATTSIDAHLVNLPSYDRAGTRSLGFADGNVTTLHFSTMQSGDRLADLALRAHVLAAGYYHSAVREEGASLHGTQVFAGLDVGYEYELHDYRRDSPAPIDRLSLVTTGLGAEHTAHFDAVSVRTRLDALLGFGGVDAFALEAYRTARSTRDLTSVLVGEGYYYTFAPVLAPAVSVGYRGLEVGASVRVDAFAQIEGLDRDPSRITQDVPVSDRRVSARTWLSVVLPGDVLRLTVWARHLQREGSIGDVNVKRAEGSGGGHLELVF
jgi:hypothetical protein